MIEKDIPIPIFSKVRHDITRHNIISSSRTSYDRYIRYVHPRESRGVELREHGSKKKYRNKGGKSYSVN